MEFYEALETINDRPKKDAIASDNSQLIAQMVQIESQDIQIPYSFWFKVKSWMEETEEWSSIQDTFVHYAGLKFVFTNGQTLGKMISAVRSYLEKNVGDVSRETLNDYLSLKKSRGKWVLSYAPDLFRYVDIIVDRDPGVLTPTQVPFYPAAPERVGGSR